MKIEPIDIDFAGWCRVPAGEHNAWGAIDDDGNLIAWAETEIGAKERAEKKIAEQ